LIATTYDANFLFSFSFNSGWILLTSYADTV
jgi:hypothetical protein